MEKISGLSVEEAKDVLLKNVESEVRHEMAMLIKDIEVRAKMKLMQRQRNNCHGYSKVFCRPRFRVTVSVVPLPNDEMKGRIIGRKVEISEL